MKQDSDNAKSKCKSLVVKAPVWMVAAVVPLVMMSGCAKFSKKHFTVGSVQDSYKTRHPIVIDEREQTLDIPVSTNSYGLPIAQAGSIEGFAYRFKKSANGVITMMLPKGSPNQRAARAVSDKVVDSIISAGVAPHSIRLVNYDASNHGPSAPIRLSYVSVSANTSECGKWPEDLAGSNNQNKNYHNFGCANQNNFAAMIANPSDLVAPRGMSEIDAERRNQTIKDYRKGDIELGPDPRSAF